MPLEGSISYYNSNLLNVAQFFYERTRLHFFYIGNEEATVEYLFQNFESGHQAKNFTEAIKLLQWLAQHDANLPDVVFIDIPLNEMELVEFCSDLNSTPLLANLPVIYSQKHLADEQIDFLQHLQLIDDIVHINSGKIDYTSKIMFLKQIKSEHERFASMKEQLRWNKSLSTHVSLAAKRTLDISICVFALLILLPVFLLVALAIKLESKGPVFYTSLRAGKGFKVFRFYKFRSMAANADKEVEKLSHLNQYDVNHSGPKFFKINNDPRITRMGKLLRNTSMDELPQLFNVLKGDMSLVGNRPLPIYEAVTLTTNDFVERFSAPAGITGLWQVNKRGKADMSTEERINLDITYSRKYNFFYDLKIMAKTPVALFQKSDV